MSNLLFVLFGFVFLFNSQIIAVQPTLAEFVHASKEEYQREFSVGELPVMHFVMCNESADLDSIVSSIAYAYLLNEDKNEGKGQSYLPLLNLRREEIALRKDALYLFQLIGISLDDLLFLDDVALDGLFAQNKLRLNLVDHNLLRPSQGHLSSTVERIIDHHVDEHNNYPLLAKEDKLIAVVGSATTLVAEKMLASQQVKINPDIAAFLLAPILLDTLNLQSKDKTTDRDRQVIELLLSKAFPVIPQDYYEKLTAAKMDTSSFTPAMLLSKDFKEYLDGGLLYGIASLPTTVSWWIEDEQMLMPIIEKFAADRKLAFLIILMANQEPYGPKRKLIVYSPSVRLLEAFKVYVQEDGSLKELLVPGPISHDKRMAYYTAESFIARKQLQPLFHFAQRDDLMAIFKEEMNEFDSFPIHVPINI
jgi:exopolyphosphatase